MPIITPERIIDALRAKGFEGRGFDRPPAGSDDGPGFRVLPVLDGEIWVCHQSPFGFPPYHGALRSYLAVLTESGIQAHLSRWVVVVPVDQEDKEAETNHG